MMFEDGRGSSDGSAWSGDSDPDATGFSCAATVDSRTSKPTRARSVPPDTHAEPLLQPTHWTTHLLATSEPRAEFKNNTGKPPSSKKHWAMHGDPEELQASNEKCHPSPFTCLTV